jgi:hypothetical protein
MKMKGKVYSACAQCVMTYDSETWPMRVEDMRRLERAEKMMIKWMCGVTLRSEKTSEQIRNRLGIVSLSDAVRQRKLRWFGHVERKGADDWVCTCRNVAVSGERGRGRKAWTEHVADDVRQLMLGQEDAQDRFVLKNDILGTVQHMQARKCGR